MHFNPLSSTLTQFSIEVLFQRVAPLGQFFLVVPISVRIYVCMCLVPSPCDFCWGLSMAPRSYDQFKAFHWSTLPPIFFTPPIFFWTPLITICFFRINKSNTMWQGWYLYPVVWVDLVMLKEILRNSKQYSKLDATCPYGSGSKKRGKRQWCSYNWDFFTKLFCLTYLRVHHNQ